MIRTDDRDDLYDNLKGFVGEYLLYISPAKDLKKDKGKHDPFIDTIYEEVVKMIDNTISLKKFKNDLI